MFGHFSFNVFAIWREQTRKKNERWLGRWSHYFNSWVVIWHFVFSTNGVHWPDCFCAVLCISICSRICSMAEYRDAETIKSDISPKQNERKKRVVLTFHKSMAYIRQLRRRIFFLISFFFFMQIIHTHIFLFCVCGAVLFIRSKSKLINQFFWCVSLTWVDQLMSVLMRKKEEINYLFSHSFATLKIYLYLYMCMCWHDANSNGSSCPQYSNVPCKKARTFCEGHN